MKISVAAPRSCIRLRTAVRKSLLPLLIAGSTPFCGAQQTGIIGQTERQEKILQERKDWARTQLAKAQEDLAANDFESAFALSKSACDALPGGGNATAGLHAEALSTFSNAALCLAKQRISEGRFEDAELVVKAAIDRPYNSTQPKLLALRKQLGDPDQFNRTMTPGFIAKVEEVKQLLNEAQGLYASGRFDAAFKDYEKVLNLDPENVSARLGMEQVNKQRSDYAGTAYNERRSQMIGDVARAWELPVPKYDTGASTIVEQEPLEIRGISSITRKLQVIRIPQLTLTDEPIRDAVDKLQKYSVKYDSTETDPSKKGVNIVLKVDSAKESSDGTRINLSLNDIPLGEALKYVTSAASLHYKVEPYAVAIVPLSESSEILLTKEYKVPPGFIYSAPADSSPSSPGATRASGGGDTTVGKTSAKDILIAQGVTFDTPGSSATYLASSSKLLVKNTQANLDLVDSLLENVTPPSQVEIEARFLEVTQNNLQELGFDWLMGAFQLPGGSGAYGGGGTVGNQVNNSGAYPMNNPNGSPVGSIANGAGGNLTSGNQTGSAAITANALDALLLPGLAATGPAPGVLALAGVFTNPQFQVVLRALNQMTGVDLVSAPKVTVTSGRKATINIVQRFPYPKDYSPPQIPQTQNGGLAPATPATPTSFQTRNVGVQLEVEPTVGPDGNTIDLSLSPRIDEFQGFVNYGNPIQTVAPFRTVAGGITLRTGSVVLTPNPIYQPVFSVRTVDTQVSIRDGQTVVLGGLMREDVQKVQDKTPILGDLPLVGSLFRSSDNQRIKRNLIIFVTAGLLDPAGQPLEKSLEHGTEVSAPDAGKLSSEAIPNDPSTASER